MLSVQEIQDRLKKNKISILEVLSRLRFGDKNQISVPFIGKGNIWINNNYSAGVVRLARNIILEAVASTAPGQLSVVGYDSDLSGVFAPFASLSSGESHQLDLIDTHEKLVRELSLLKQQIKDVQNVVQGRCDSLMEFRAKMDSPIEGYKLVVISMDMGMIEQSLRSQLAMLMRSGPAFGISFMIISTTYMSIQTSSGSEIDISVESLAGNITVLDVSGNTVTEEKSGASASFRPFLAEDIISSCELFTKALRSAQLPVVYFTDIHDISAQWKESSIEGLTFTLGKYGINDMKVTIGDEINQRHNIIITGAVGQGKSNLISVIIHSLCTTYSPRELQLYLLDFKEGVTFKPFSNIGQKEYLPHARTLGLESDVNFGIAVLEALFDEYLKRMKMLKDYNAKSLRELRNQHPEIEMPRIVAVIDEFQMMFGDDNDLQKGQKVAELLEKSLRLFRAAGIHFILASQTLKGSMALIQKLESMQAQVPIRIALKNSAEESINTFGISNNNQAAALLRPREAIVNLDYGRPPQNQKTVVAFADEKVLIPVRREWWRRAHSKYAPPYVFESVKRIKVTSAQDDIKNFSLPDGTPAAFIGECISVNGECISIPMSAEPGKNIAVFGSPENECNTAVGIMQSIAISLAMQDASGDARFLFCDFSSRNQMYDKAYPAFAQIMMNMGYFLECIPQSDFAGVVNELSELENNEDNIYLFASSLDKWMPEDSPFGGDPPLKKLAEHGPARNIHIIGWWVKESSFKKQVVGFTTGESFNTKLFLRIDQSSIQSLTANPFVRWTALPNRMLVTDSVELAEPIAGIPYSPVGSEDIGMLNK